MLKSDKMVGYPGLLGCREGVAFCDSVRTDWLSSRLRHSAILTAFHSFARVTRRGVPGAL